MTELFRKFSDFEYRFSDTSSTFISIFHETVSTESHFVGDSSISVFLEFHFSPPLSEGDFEGDFEG